MSSSNPKIRLATIAELARQGEGRFGRTAIMKLCYFLQTIYKMPLHYSFRLYTYGPYDGQVLEDLKIAQSLRAVQTKSFEWPGGVGVTIEPAEHFDAVQKSAGSTFEPIKAAIKKVMSEFGRRNASDLELLSTIIYVDRSYKSAGKSTSASEIVSHVHDIKPHHDKKKIELELNALAKKGLLQAIKAAA